MALDDATQQRMLQALAKTLRAQHGSRVEHYQTHISRILVCGDKAYKFRRPLKLPFADFSTLTKRRADCQREQRLNQRTAAILYQGIATITGTLDAPSIDGPGQVIDVALRMQRFEQSGLLSHLALKSQLSDDLIASLGKHLGEFMQQLPALTARKATGLRPTQQWLEDSLNEICTLAPNLRAAVREIRRWSRSTDQRLRHLMRQRQRAGFYRDGHGDLHLGNLVRFEGEVMAFDALEFNDDLRQTDIINDIAFTFMDLFLKSCAYLRIGFIRSQWYGRPYLTLRHQSALK